MMFEIHFPEWVCLQGIVTHAAHGLQYLQIKQIV